MYQQTLGRFLSRDPLAENGMDVMTDTGFYGERLAAMRANPWYYGGNSEHPYVYARNNPVRYTDPSGLSVILRCNPVSKFGITFGYHCGIIVECNGKVCRFDGGGERTTGQDPRYPDRPVPTKECTNKPVPPLGENEHDYKVCSPWKSCENELRCLENAFARILQLPYQRLGPNSNTYAHALLCVCGLKFEVFQIPGTPDPRIGAPVPPITIERPPNAPGWDTSGYGCAVEGGPFPDWWILF